MSGTLTNSLVAPVDFSDSGTDSTGGSIPYGDHDDGVNNAMEIDRKSPAAPEKREADDGDDEEDSDEEEEDVLVFILSWLLRIIN